MEWASSLGGNDPMTGLSQHANARTYSTDISSGRNGVLRAGCNASTVENETSHPADDSRSQLAFVDSWTAGLICQEDSDK